MRKGCKDNLILGYENTLNVRTDLCIWKKIVMIRFVSGLLFLFARFWRPHTSMYTDTDPHLFFPSILVLDSCSLQNDSWIKGLELIFVVSSFKAPVLSSSLLPVWLDGSCFKSWKQSFRFPGTKHHTFMLQTSQNSDWWTTVCVCVVWCGEYYAFLVIGMGWIPLQEDKLVNNFSLATKCFLQMPIVSHFSLTFFPSLDIFSVQLTWFVVSKSTFPHGQRVAYQWLPPIPSTSFFLKTKKQPLQCELHISVVDSSSHACCGPSRSLLQSVLPPLKPAGPTL